MKPFSIPKEYGPKTEAETWYDEMCDIYNEYLRECAKRHEAKIMSITKEMERRKERKRMTYGTVIQPDDKNGNLLRACELVTDILEATLENGANDLFCGDAIKWSRTAISECKKE